MNLSDDYINGNLIEEFSMNVNPIIKQGRSADPKWSSYSFNKFNEKSKIVFSMEVMTDDAFFQGDVEGGRVITKTVGEQEVQKRTNIIS